MINRESDIDPQSVADLPKGKNPYGSSRSIAVMPGGGSWGLLSAFTAREYERKSGKPFHENFDQIEAVSVGTLNAAVLWPLECTERPLLFARDLKYFYMTRTDDLFPKNWRSLNGLVGHKYDLSDLEELMDRTFEGLKLSDYSDGFHIYVVDMETQSPRKLTSEEAKLDPANDYYIKDLIRTAISAPYYFKPIRIENMAGESKEFVDAGLWASNPAFKAYFDARADGVEPENMAITVFDTGMRATDVRMNDIKGGISDIDNIVQLMFNTSANTYEEMLTERLGPNYTVITTDVTESGIGMISNRPEKLIPYAQKALSENKEAIDRAIENAAKYKDTTIIRAGSVFNDRSGLETPSGPKRPTEYKNNCSKDSPISDLVRQVREEAANHRQDNPDNSDDENKPPKFMV